LTKFERIILTSAPITIIRNVSKKIILPGFEGLPLYDVFKFFIEQVNKVGLNERAAAISFNFLMAIPAACIFFFTLVPYLPISKQFIAELIRVVQQVSPDKQTKALIIDFMQDFFTKPKTGLLSLGFILAIFYSSNAMMGIIRTFDKSLANRYNTNFIEKRWRAIKLTTILILLIIGTILVSLGQGFIFSKIMKLLHIKSSSIKFWIQLIRLVIVIALFIYSIGLIYKLAPSVKERWKIHSPGAIFATILLIISTDVFSYWAQNISNYNKFYGSIGSILILMLLIYINSLILLIGFELNVSISSLKEAAKKRTEVDAQI